MATLAVAVLISASFAFGKEKSGEKTADKTADKSSEKASEQTETYHDIIQKAQNLTLQRDRLQTSQVLLRAISRESKNTVGYREMTKALSELTSVFYTEKAQSVFVAGESLYEAKPREALDQFLEALRLEDGNVAILKTTARCELTLGECTKADTYVKSAEAMDPYSPEVRLLRLQVLDCSKAGDDVMAAKLDTVDDDLGTLAKFAHGIEIKNLVREKELKKAKAVLTTWETQMSDYPEIFYWKWELSRLAGSPERAPALRYSTLCQNLTLHKRKSYILDVDLCKGKDAVDAYLKESGLQQTAPTEDNSAD